jgi:putative ABC transport system permease protein
MKNGLLSSGISFSNYDEFPGQIINNQYKIIGVVKDFHFNSLHQAVGPLMMAWHDHSMWVASIKIDTKVADAAINFIEENWNNTSPDDIFAFSYLKDSFDHLYENEKRMGVILVSFSSFAVLIAFMWLFGITSFMIDKRTREISIRMVLGETPIKIMYLISREFLVLIIISLTIATPICWMAMHTWLDSYASRVNITGLPFILAGVVAIILMITTMGYHVIKLSHHNPSDVLNRE